MKKPWPDSNIASVFAVLWPIYRVSQRDTCSHGRSMAGSIELCSSRHQTKSPSSVPTDLGIAVLVSKETHQLHTHSPGITTTSADMTFLPSS